MAEPLGTVFSYLQVGKTEEKKGQVTPLTTNFKLRVGKSLAKNLFYLLSKKLVFFPFSAR